MVSPTGMGPLNRGRMGASLKPYRNMDGDREISIRIFSVLFFSDTLKANLLRGSAKDVSNGQKGKPRLDSRKRLPESVQGSNQHFRRSRISYVTGRIYTLTQGALSGTSVGKGLVLLAKYNR